jgi:hypothetical protein
MKHVLLVLILNEYMYFETLETVLACELRKVEIRKQNPQANPTCIPILERPADARLNS